LIKIPKLPPVAFVSFSGEGDYFQLSCGDQEKSIGFGEKNAIGKNVILKIHVNWRKWVEG
jgi:hypothetical protein